MVYINTPPENGTFSYVHSGSEANIHYYNISVSGWEDDLDGEILFYRCVSSYEIDNPGHAAMHEGTSDTDFQITVSYRDAGIVYLRVYDSHGGYTEVLIGSLGQIEHRPDIPGFSVYIMIVSCLAIITAILWKIKKKTR